MATVKICSIETIFQDGEHIATSYQFYNGSTGEIIDESIENKESLLIWNSQLAVGDGTHYRNLTDLRARVKLHYDGSDSNWIELGSYDQTDPDQPIYSCTI